MALQSKYSVRTIIISNATRTGTEQSTGTVFSKPLAPSIDKRPSLSILSCSYPGQSNTPA